MKIYGSMLCKDCIACRKDLDGRGVAYEFKDFAEDLQNLKDFLVIRDTHPTFAELHGEPKIGIPCIVLDDGKVTLDWNDLG